MRVEHDGDTPSSPPRRAPTTSWYYNLLAIPTKSAARRAEPFDVVVNR